jgi:hypothetical protein
MVTDAEIEAMPEKYTPQLHAVTEGRKMEQRLMKALRAIRDRVGEEDPETVSDCEKECFEIADRAIIDNEVFIQPTYEGKFHVEWGSEKNEH